MSKIIDDEVLYANMPHAERLILNQIPPEKELDHKFSQRFNRKMKALLKYEQRTPTMRRFMRQMKTAVAMLLIVLTLSFGTVMSVEAYRIRFFEFVVEIWEEFTSIVTQSDHNADQDTLIPVSPSYVPEGYSILEEIQEKYENIIIYANENGTEIYYSQELLTQGEVILDSENTEIKKVLIDSQEIYLISDEGVTQLYWHDKNSSYSLIGRLAEIELIKMAESIIK